MIGNDILPPLGATDDNPPLCVRIPGRSTWGGAAMASGKKCPEFASFEAIPDAVIITGRAGSIVFGNRHAERVFGYERGKLVGLAIESLIPKRCGEDDVSS